MPTNTDFRVKNGLYVGDNINALRGSVSALRYYGKLFDVSTSGTLGSGSTDAISGQNTFNFEAVSGIAVTVSDNNLKFNISASSSFEFNSDILDLTDTGVISGTYGSTTSIPTFTVDAQGRLTEAGSTTIATTLSTAGDSTTGDVDLLTEVLSVIGTANEIETTATDNAIQIGFTTNVTMPGNLTVTGDFIVNGNTTTQNVSSILIEDPVIKLANGNTAADSVDIGFYGEYADSGTKYTGLIRDVTFAGGNKPYVFFAGTTTDILSDNDSGSAKPGVSEFADVYMGRIGINTSDYDANNRLTVSGQISGDDAIIIDGAGTFRSTLDVTGNVTIGGGYGSTGITITSTGDLSADGGIYADSFFSKTAGNTIDFNDAVDIDGTLTANNTVTFSGLGTGTDNTVVILDSSNNLTTDEIDSRVWGSSLVDGSGTLNRLSKWTETGDTLGDTQISDDATTVTIGVSQTNPFIIEPTSTSTSIKFANNTSGYHSTCTSVTQSTSAIVLSFPHADYRSGKIVVQSDVNNAQYEVAELLLIHNGSDTYQTEYGNISTAGTFCVTYTSRINGSNLEVIATNACSGGSADVITTITQLTNT